MLINTYQLNFTIKDKETAERFVDALVESFEEPEVEFSMPRARQLRTAEEIQNLMKKRKLNNGTV